MVTVRFDVEVRFDTGVVTGDGSDAESLTQLGELLIARAQARNGDPVGIEGGHTKFVGDIRSIRIEAKF